MHWSQTELYHIASIVSRGWAYDEHFPAGWMKDDLARGGIGESDEERKVFGLEEAFYWENSYELPEADTIPSPPNPEILTGTLQELCEWYYSADDLRTVPHDLMLRIASHIEYKSKE